MKISIAWAFDHIQADYRSIDISALIGKLNETTAEIENYRSVESSLDHISLVTIQSITNHIYAFSPEWGKKITLSKRHDAIEQGWYMVVKKEGEYHFATSVDCGGNKEFLLPSLQVSPSEQAGSWKKRWEKKDVIFEVDNKSINHRPDLWGHRGFAREIAAILGYRLKPIEDFCESITIIPHEQKATDSRECPFNIEIQDEQEIHRFAGLYVADVVYTPSLLWMVGRLSRVDNRALNALVDATNYVMLDMGQPMHAFDADTLTHQSIVCRKARNKEVLTLLDDTMIELTDQDLVIADGQQPIALAGIMGGKGSAVRPTTTALFLESANFDAAAIRRSSQLHKIRTEASARFEKSLDPNQNVVALTRFIRLLYDAHIPVTKKGNIVSLGSLMQSPSVQVAHQFIEDRLGISLAPSFVHSTLEKLDFYVREKHEKKNLIYTIVVPSFRATKDIAIKEDIVEEIGRFYGYSNITFTLPRLKTQPSPIHAILQQHNIKELLAFGICMRELATYAFFDESFLKKIEWNPEYTLQVKDPVSENWHRLVTTLMPNMFKAITENYITHDELRFFEWGRTWYNGEEILEKKVLTGVFYTKHKPIHFYDVKAELHRVFLQIGMPVQWQFAQQAPYAWFDGPYTAELVHAGKVLGVAGFVDPMFVQKFAEGFLFVFELNADMLSFYKKPYTRFEPLPKYPSIERDISLMVPFTITVEKLTNIIKQVNPMIRSVALIDIFQKREWRKEHALTFRYLIRCDDKTMTKDDADNIARNVREAVERAGAVIR